MALPLSLDGFDRPGYDSAMIKSFNVEIVDYH